ncbi:M1 family aminopeptidase [Nonomuraea thailandensis]
MVALPRPERAGADRHAGRAAARARAVHGRGALPRQRQGAARRLTGWNFGPDGGFAAAAQSSRADTFFPVNDHPSDKATWTFRVTAPEGYVATANGELAGRRGNVWRFEAREPMASELIALAVVKGTYLYGKGPHGLPLRHVVPQGQEDRYGPVAAETGDQIAWAEAKFGRFPFSTYGVHIYPGYRNALENQTLSLFGTGWFDQPTYSNTMVHELVHQWFGDSVTPATWQDAWLNEGPPSTTRPCGPRSTAASPCRSGCAPCTASSTPSAPRTARREGPGRSAATTSTTAAPSSCTPCAPRSATPPSTGSCAGGCSGTRTATPPRRTSSPTPPPPRTGPAWTASCATGSTAPRTLPGGHVNSAIALVLLLTTTPAVAPGPKIYYAAPDGGSPACSQARPCSLEAARDKVRQAVEGGMSRDIEVRLTGGVYRMAEPLLLDGRDSGPDGHTVTWTAAPGSRPVLSGGVRITGWTRQGRFMVARAPEGVTPRQLFVGGARAIRARGAACPAAVCDATKTGMTGAVQSGVSGWSAPRTPKRSSRSGGATTGAASTAWTAMPSPSRSRAGRTRRAAPAAPAPPGTPRRSTPPATAASPSSTTPASCSTSRASSSTTARTGPSRTCPGPGRISARRSSRPARRSCGSTAGAGSGSRAWASSTPPTTSPAPTRDTRAPRPGSP